MRPSRITSYRSFGGNCEAPSKIQVLPRFLSRLKSQVSSRHFYEGQCKAPDVVAREINHVEGLGASPARKAHYPPLVRKLPNLPPRVGGASFALGMMLSHPAKSCDTTVLSCLSFQSHAFFTVSQALPLYDRLSARVLLEPIESDISVFIPCRKISSVHSNNPSADSSESKHLSDKLDSNMIYFNFPPP